MARMTGRFPGFHSRNPFKSQVSQRRSNDPADLGSTSSLPSRRINRFHGLRRPLRVLKLRRGEPQDVIQRSRHQRLDPVERLQAAAFPPVLDSNRTFFFRWHAPQFLAHFLGAFHRRRVRMRIYQNEDVGIIEIEVPGDPAGGLGVVVCEEHGELLPAAGKRCGCGDRQQKTNGMVQASVFCRV